MGQAGAATPSGTAGYRKRMSRTAPEHFRKDQDLWFSSIGLGSYLGYHDDATDASYRNAISHAVQLGCNVFDTSINYRCQRSERVIGNTLNTLFQEGKVQRQEIVVATKGGFIPYDGRPPSNPARYIQETFIQPGILNPDDLVANCHCITPRYLDHQLSQSLQNLELDTIDIYYLHNPEMQLEEVSREEFYRRMRAAFELLEQRVADGKLQFYGTATWNGFRNQPTSVDHLELAALVKLAREIAGERHHFRVIQLPYNLAMPEAFTFENQPVDGTLRSIIEAAKELEVMVMTSAAIMQTRLAHNLPDEIRAHFKGLHTDAQCAIQFVRSTPGIMAALVGMSRQMHVEENLQTATVAPLTVDGFLKLFSESN